MMRRLAALLAVLLAVPAGATERGTVRFTPADDPAGTPEDYRLTAHDFAFELTPKYTLPHSGVRVDVLRFPSPVTTPYPENNTVYAEFYRPVGGTTPRPAVVVLDILGGDQTLSRTLCMHFAQNGVAGLFVQMAYYGPRRPTGSRVRLLSPDIRHTLGAVRQTVLDIRRAAAWLASRPDVDARRLGLMGTSLGSLVGGVAAGAEPRFRRVALALSGGGLVDAFWDHPHAAVARRAYELFGGTREKVAATVAAADPITLAGRLRGRDVLLVAAARDEIIPPSAARALWRAAGEPRIVWYETTHYGAALFALPVFQLLADHFGAP